MIYLATKEGKKRKVYGWQISFQDKADQGDEGHMTHKYCGP